MQGSRYIYLEVHPPEIDLKAANKLPLPREICRFWSACSRAAQPTFIGWQIGKSSAASDESTYYLLQKLRNQFYCKNNNQIIFLTINRTL